MSVVRIDEDKVGFTRDSEEFRVNTARLAHFAAALGVTSGALAEGSVAHPVFAHVPVMQSMAEALRAAVPGFAFHGEHDFHCHAQIRPGQRLRTVSEVQGMRQTRAGAALVLRSSLRDAEGRLVNVQYTTGIVPGARLTRDRGEAAPARPDTGHLRAGDPAETSIAIADDLARRYADASRDYSPYTMRRDAAEALGLPHPILHGMCMLGLAVAPLLGADRDAMRLSRLGCRFSHPLYLSGGRSITVRHWNDAASAAFEIIDDAGNPIVGNGFAEFRA